MDGLPLLLDPMVCVSWGKSWSTGGAGTDVCFAQPGEQVVACEE
jgi:hypothetical protein